MALLTKCVPFVILATLVSADTKDLTAGERQFSGGKQMKDLVAPIRRLQSEGQPPAACMAACPTLLTAVQDITSKAASMSDSTSDSMSDSNQSSLDSAAMGDAMGSMLQALCANKEAFLCVQANNASGKPCAGLADEGMSQMISQMDCFCTACPCAGHVYGSVLTMMALAFSGGSGGGEVDMASQMDSICPVVEPLHCMQSSSACAAMIAMLSGMGSSLATLKPTCEAMNKPTRPAACDAQVDGSMQTCGDVKKAFKAAGCCGNPTKTFTSPDGQNRRLSSAAASEADLLGSVKAALRKAKLEGGETKSGRLAKMIGDIVKEYTQNAA
eukprot:TRINITY_DN6031_c0_g1_i4.p1 TRINITY_DN6031_c0_g1~~TRINITY_DN6031_c0_g1_i4.p1  ORF type:complete len:379 (-),score=89.56 TRINITY_DN6031_c0_g1_i4:379-1362(-)